MGAENLRLAKKGLVSLLFMLLLTFSFQGAIAGPVYFNVFNEEGEAGSTALIATYGSLFDMTTNSNPLTLSYAIGNGADFGADGAYIVGSGATTFAEAPSGDVPEPASLSLVGLGLLGFGAAKRRRTQRAI